MLLHVVKSPVPVHTSCHSLAFVDGCVCHMHCLALSIASDIQHGHLMQQLYVRLANEQ